MGSGKLEVGSWKLEVGSGKLGVGSWKLGVGSEKLEVGSQKIEVGSQKIEVGSQKLEVGNPKQQTTNNKPQTQNPKPQTQERRSSALSLKSLTKKREETNKPKVELNLDEMPRNPFTKQELLDLWQIYINELNKKGEKLLASLLNSNIPEVSLNTLTFTLPNARMESSFEKAKPIVLRYLREKLQNYKIDFKIIINEEFEKKFAYTPKEKYEVLREKNPLLSKLKKTFDLDV